MRNDNAAARHIRRDLRQAIGDVFVGEAVKPVPAHAVRIEAFRQRIMIG